jgi:hypothetical protein
VGESVVIALDVLEREMRVDGNWNETREERAEEGKNELVAVRDDERNSVSLAKPPGGEMPRPSFGLARHLVKRAKALFAVRTDEYEATSTIVHERANGINEGRGEHSAVEAGCNARTLHSQVARGNA